MKLPTVVITKIEMGNDLTKPIQFVGRARRGEYIIKLPYHLNDTTNKELASAQYATILQCFHSGKAVIINTIAADTETTPIYTLDSITLDITDSVSHQ
ncbi:hypothetical protein ACNFJN_06360 [Xenorhabdus budapestensis]|uniref:hypothetical protein n=1 Tax=Xenorhabdus budapestensis TaxID=290110 RepID=UPI003A899B14